MEKKNTVLLTVIAVATLLVAVVGATFAYFTATNSTTGEGNNTTVNTRTDMGGVDLVLAPVTVTGSNVTYPAGYVVNAASVTATSQGTDNYTVNYTLNGIITNNTDTALNYKVVRLTSALDSELVSGCTMRSYVGGATNNETRYTYLSSGQTSSGDAWGTNSSCTLNSTLRTATGASTVIASGTVDPKSGDTATVENISVASSASNGMILTSAATPGTTYYYYIVVEYPDTGASQAATAATIRAEFTNLTGSSAVSTQG